MITPEEFKQIVEDLGGNVLVSQDRIRSLVETVAELDTQNLVLSGSLQFALDSADQLFLTYGSTIAAVIGIRDLGKKRRIAEAGAEAAARLRGAVQAAILGMIEEAQQIATQGLAVDDLGEGAGDEGPAGPVAAAGDGTVGVDGVDD